MPYRFQPGEDIGAALSRIGLEQFDRALACLKKAEAGKAVHETRKCIKRLRALLRLVRTGIGSDFARENERLRDIARALSAERDRVVLAATLEQIAPGSAAARMLARGLDTPTTKMKQLAARRLIKAAIADLAKAREDWKSLDPGTGPKALEAISNGLERGLADLRDTLTVADGGEDEAVHDWRKAVQRHWRHMRLMEAGWPTYFQSRVEEAKAVSDLLGRSQDLSLLVRWLDAGPAGIRADEAEVLRTAALAAQSEARKEARMRCLRLTAEGPKAHARRAVAYWTTAGDIAVPPAKAAAHRVEGGRISRTAAKPARRTVSGRKRRLPRRSTRSA